MEEQERQVFARLVIGPKICKHNPNLGITQEYNKVNRDKLWDSPEAKKSYKEALYNGKKEYVDPISGNTLLSSQTAAQNKYHKKNSSGENVSSAWAKYSPETDHIISLKRLHRRLKKNPFLSNADFKEIANNKNNHRVLSKALNGSKGEKSDIQIAFDIKQNFSIKGRSTLITETINAEIHMASAISAKTLQNVGNEFTSGAAVALEASAIPLMVCCVQNICQVASGEKTMQEAAKDMGELAGKIAVFGGGRQLATDIVAAANNAGSELLKNALAKSNEITQIISITLLVKDSFIKLINSEISGTEFFEEIGEKGVELISGTIGSLVGSAAMTALLPATMAAGPAALLVAAGSFVCAIVISTVCTEIYRYTAKLRKYFLDIDKKHKEKMACINRIANEAITEIQHQQTVLKTMITTTFKDWDKQFEFGFNNILEAAYNNNFELLSSGLNTILNVFGETVMFKTMDEFDEFFFDENAVLKL